VDGLRPRSRAWKFAFIGAVAFFVAFIGTFVAAFVYFGPPQAIAFASLGVALIGLLFSGYATWAASRDRKVEALGNVRGCVYLFLASTNYIGKLIDDPNKQNEAYWCKDDLKKQCGIVAEKIEDALSKTGGFMRSETHVSVRNFTTVLRELKGTEFKSFDEYRARWNDVIQESVALSDRMGKEIELHKFRNIFLG
jgi:hypothetical protein